MPAREAARSIAQASRVVSTASAVGAAKNHRAKHWRLGRAKISAKSAAVSGFLVRAKKAAARLAKKGATFAFDQKRKNQNQSPKSTAPTTSAAASGVVASRK